MGAAGGRQSLESQIDTIAKAKATGIAERKGLLQVIILIHRPLQQFKFKRYFQVFKDLVRQLLQGKALSIEDAVDVLTLKDNAETLEDFATALQLVIRAVVSGILFFGDFNRD